MKDYFQKSRYYINKDESVTIIKKNIIHAKLYIIKKDTLNVFNYYTLLLIKHK